ncbi:hypothetical protein HK107_08855 [Parvularcula sp. ZS-1/3]|uniref:Phytase-like domain-containing protein n=1 Tax=Parvularcula mediterranea TaxID=2732508 RepID=A0A7Y3RLR2_9PROT|nr:esterase-like activity of phytase family protein [Parvularcula mediterranea]NNU16428.1 hypothetical protein [Parvularcula mediterranea]
MISMLLAASALAAADMPAPIRVRAFPGLGENGLEIGCMTMVSGHVLFGPEAFGGYSGMHLDEEQKKLTLLSDRAHLLFADVEISDEGEVVSLSNGVMREMGFAAREIRPVRDTEALIGADGGFFVSRERRQDLVMVEVDDLRAEAVRIEMNFGVVDGVEGNGGYEGVTALPGGGYVAIPETVFAGGLSPVVIAKDGIAAASGFHKPRDEHAVTDLSVDDQGETLLILERAYSRAKGPRARIAAVPVGELGSGATDVLPAEELGRLTFLDGADNMEGMTFFRAKNGAPHLLLISDDNHNDIQRTVLMSLRLNESCPL